MKNYDEDEDYGDPVFPAHRVRRKRKLSPDGEYFANLIDEHRRVCKKSLTIYFIFLGVFLAAFFILMIIVMIVVTAAAR